MHIIEKYCRTSVVGGEGEAEKLGGGYDTFWDNWNQSGSRGGGRQQSRAGVIKLVSTYTLWTPCISLTVEVGCWGVGWGGSRRGIKLLTSYTL